jgi:chemotaxis protein CheX
VSLAPGKTTSLAIQIEPAWKNILECAAIEVFELMASVKLEPMDSSAGKPHGDTTAIVGMAGALCGMTAIRCSRESAGKLASCMLGSEASSNSSTIGDALGELCNMVAGNFKSKFSSLAEHCMLSVPTVISGEDYSMQPIDPFETVVVALDYEGSAIWITLIVHT